MAHSVYLGIDTSNYTTSAAVVSDEGEDFRAKRILEVPHGEKGVRQSDALFCHTRDLSAILGEALAKARARFPDARIAAVGVSTRPRSVEGSYMPCFLAGVNAARSIAEALDVPCYEVSHQEGHIEAARFGATRLGKPFPADAREFLAFHLSGGTGELLCVKEKGVGYETRLLFETLDITPGQLIDRAGVLLGLDFPAGKELEKLAEKENRSFSVKIPKKEGGVNLSGFENKVREMIEKGEKPETVASYVFAVVREAASAMLEHAPEDLPVLFGGGVSSSHLLREALARDNHYFAHPDYTADNAVGVALIARKGVFLGRAPGDQCNPVK